MKPIYSFIIISLVLLILAPHAGAQTFDGTNFSSDQPFFKVAPYEFDKSEQYFIFFKTDSLVMRELVPEPLTPLGDEMSLFFAKHHLVSPFKLDYHEVYFLIPVRFGDTKGTYMPVLYLDNAAGIIPGREIVGYNKVGGDIHFAEAGKNVNITLAQNDTVLIRAEFKIGIKLSPDRASGDGWSFNLKYIPSALEDTEAEVKQLVRAKYTDKGVEKLRFAKADLKFTPTHLNPLDKIPVIRITQSGYIVGSSSLSDTKIVHDYLKE